MVAAQGLGSRPHRSETLETAPDGVGARCCWEWTSDLHVTKVFPSLSRRLLQRALRDRPISFAEAPTRKTGRVQVSFVIGHRGPTDYPIFWRQYVRSRRRKT